MSSNTVLCPTAKIIAQVLDGASERAVLLAEDGTVLHTNTAASNFLFLRPHNPHVSDFLAANADFHSISKSRVKMKSGKTTRSERNVHLQILDKCVCCSSHYYTAYICSKHERVREVVDIAFDAVLTMDESGVICTVNQAAVDLFGYQECELIGKSMGMICGGEHAQLHDTYMTKYMESGIQKMIGQKRETIGLRKNGTEFPCELGIQEIVDVSSGKHYFCGFIRDLTQIKQQEAEIEERQALQQAMINASFDSMLEVNELGDIQIVNDAACSMFGYTREEFLGKNLSQICGDGHGSMHEAYMKRYLDTGEQHIIGRKRQVKAKRKDGSEFEIELGVQEVTLTDGKKAFCGYMRDLTQQKKDKRALQKQARMIHGKFFGTNEEDAEEVGEATCQGCPFGTTTY
jgi:PAS domain S-box-containing protein